MSERDEARRRLGVPEPAVLAGRSALLASLRAFFAARDYIEVEAPVIVAAPGLEPNIAAVATSVCGKSAWLHTSAELSMKKLVAAGNDRIYSLQRVFRDGEVTERHNPEFTMLEWYRVGATAATMMDETAALVRSVLDVGPIVRVSFADLFLSLGIDFLKIHSTAEFARAANTIGVRTAADDAFDDVFHRVCIERIDQTLPKACFVTDYPVELAVLARRNPLRPRFGERFELFIDGLELCNGFAELTDPVEQRARFVADQEERRRRGLPVYPIDEAFLDVLSAVPECAGNALGVDRLAMLVLGKASIGEVNAFVHGRLF